ncbi:MAG: 2-succinyl-5-enolpyruvyl-6-hydroxy-3-cyclohexene-1-carboxylate synthase, partial [Fermentimonas sp.]|nr:2-succinyl-5-enolpyruvyl-6-hydroxy-3-cyclohexene-1-carboxylate synthase [Fermentimonas sp.]
MYSDKKSVLELVALLKAHDITQIVLSPGSRNSPLIHSFANDSDFKCYSIVDERSAG